MRDIVFVSYRKKVFELFHKNLFENYEQINIRSLCLVSSKYTIYDEARLQCEFYDKVLPVPSCSSTHHDIVHIYEILFSRSRKVFYKPYRKRFGHKETRDIGDSRIHYINKLPPKNASKHFINAKISPVKYHPPTLKLFCAFF